MLSAAIKNTFFLGKVVSGHQEERIVYQCTWEQTAPKLRLASNARSNGAAMRMPLQSIYYERRILVDRCCSISRIIYIRLIH